VAGERGEGGRCRDRPVENSGSDVEMTDGLAGAALAQHRHGGNHMRPRQGRPSGKRRTKRAKRTLGVAALQERFGMLHRGREFRAHCILRFHDVPPPG
jgi:hypothetical protein